MYCVKAYEELWSSRLIPQPLDNLIINTLSIEELEKEVTRCYKIERILNHDTLTPAHFRHLHGQQLGVLFRIIQTPNSLQLHIVKGRYLFSKIRGLLCCHVYSQSEGLERVWYSNSVFSHEDIHIRSSTYFEDGREILVIINVG